MGRLDGRVAIISGGARGMGASHARGLVAEGAQVMIGDILDAEGAALAAELGPACRYARLDVTCEADWAAAVEQAEAAFGPVNVLINNAGVVTWRSVARTSGEEFRRVVDINLTGVFHGMHATIPSMRLAGGGVIVNISSTAGLMAFGSAAAYVASKWGVRGLTKAAALELGLEGIRVVSVHPGAIRTPMTQRANESACSGQPIPRIGEPEEVTKLVVFLLSEATFSTGSEFVIDGGAVLVGPVDPIATGARVPGA
jgi:3alpha(or 20beta)-hydroxysteroid dehydrogenase